MSFKTAIVIKDRKNAPRFDLVTEEVLWQLPRKAAVKQTNLINAAFGTVELFEHQTVEQKLL